MNPRCIISLILSFLVSGHVLAQSQDMDKELSSLAEKLTKQIADNGKKKVTVIDFTDLQGDTQGELGKYIAEQLTIDLVMEKRGFSVLDRANLRKILAEHKLTSQGLVDPENAKKLGMFAGVDALILGTIVPKEQTMSLTAKIITTDTAEIVGAARAEFKTDSTVKQLVSTPVKTEDASIGQEKPAPRVKPFGDLEAKVESMKFNPGNYLSGSTTLTLIITNTSSSKTYGVSIDNPIRNGSLSNSRGDQMSISEVVGIEQGWADQYNGSFHGSMTDIPPASSILVVVKSTIYWGQNKPGDYRPYRLQTIMFFGVEDNGRYPDVKKLNLVMDIK